VLLVPPDDADALQDALRRALGDAGLRDRLITAGRIRAGEFAMPRLAASFIKRYESIRGEGPGARPMRTAPSLTAGHEVPRRPL
jgi:glycosyltransferase involved in cell wall biosynthesis